MPKPDIWMPLYIGDYLADTMHLTTLEHGAYLKAIMAYWMRGNQLPGDDESFANICGLHGDDRKHLPTIKAFFTVSPDGTLSHGRIDRELLRARERSEKAAEAGRASAKVRWKSNNITCVKRTLSLGGNSDVTQVVTKRQLGSNPSQSPSQSQLHIQTPPPTTPPSGGQATPPPLTTYTKAETITVDTTTGEEVESTKPRRPSRQPDELWDTIAELWFGGNVAEPDRTRVGRLRKIFHQHRASGEEIRKRFAFYRQRWPDAAATPEAIAKHWASLTSVVGTPLINCLTGLPILENA